jgi:anti-sigma factor RsiW
MDCHEIEAFLEAYADGELEVGERGLVGAHLAGCAACGERVAEHGRYRHLLRRQPRETAPPELRARVIRTVRRRALGRLLAPWAAGVAVAAAGLLVVAGGVIRREASPPAIVTELVRKHIAYAQIEAPTELASADRGVVQAWFRARLGVGVPVPDYSAAGIRLLGGRIADAAGHRAAYLLYEKGRTLMSVFAVPGAALPSERGHVIRYRGFEYSTADVAGLRAVFWSDGDMAFGLVSMLDMESLLECADRLRGGRARAAGVPLPA